MTEQDDWGGVVYADYDDETLLSRLIEISYNVQYFDREVRRLDNQIGAACDAGLISARSLARAVKRQAAVKAEILKRMQNHDQ